MNLLLDLVVDVLASGLGPQPTNRGLLVLFTTGGLALAGTSAWLTATGVDVVRAPDWKVGVLLASLLGGSAGMLVSVLHLRREPAERVLASACLIINTLAVLIPFVSFRG